MLIDWQGRVPDMSNLILLNVVAKFSELDAEVQRLAKQALRGKWWTWSESGMLATKLTRIVATRI